VKRPRSKDVRVLLVGPVPPPYGGIAAYVRDLAAEPLEGVKLELFNTAFPGWIVPLNREGRRHYQSLAENGPWTALKMVVYVLISYPRLFVTLVIRRPAIVQVFPCSYWGYWRNWLYVQLARACGRKVIFHLLNAIDVFYEDVSDRQKSWIERSLNSADLYLLQSPELQKWVEQYSRRRVKGIWNGIHLDRIPAREVRQDLRPFSNVPTGITVGGLSENKGTGDILDALKALRARGVDVGWVFVGGGDVNGFSERADRDGLSDRVLFAGRVSEADKWQRLHQADVFCLPSRAEGQPIAIIEAMAVGLPVIASSVGSIPEMIVHGHSGLVIPVGDGVALQDAIEQLVMHEDLRERMGKGALRAAKARHNVQDQYISLANVYQDLSGFAA
jgi:glycosyltransferase involved in cell wall biosynthesis